MPFNPTEHPHRRYNPLTGEWVLVSPHRTKRPWLGQVERLPSEVHPQYDPTCYLCPGNERAGGVANPAYENTFVFTNDFAALLPDSPPSIDEPASLFRSSAVQGTCRVICFSPRHDLTLPEMELSDIRRVIDVWAEEVSDLGKRYKWVQVFENKGAIMGASNPHPHGQVWALNTLPNEPAKEDHHQFVYHAAHNRHLLLDYARQEIKNCERVVFFNDFWLVLVPYWAVWPFETMLLPLFPVRRLDDLSGPQRDALASALKRLLTRYDNLFETSFPYSMGWHAAPWGAENLHWQLHAHFYPPLLRSATVKKFMVGFEMLGEPQRDLTPEQAAARVRQMSDLHYKKM